MNKSNAVADKSFTFSIAIIGLCKELRVKKEFIIANQLLRCGTGIGANIAEASSAQSRKDFISKMYIALKEARETNYWLLLIKETGILDFNLYDLFYKNDELIRLLVASINTAKSNS